MAKHRAGAQRKRKCIGCGGEFNTKEMSAHISGIIEGLKIEGKKDV